MVKLEKYKETNIKITKYRENGNYQMVEQLTISPINRMVAKGIVRDNLEWKSGLCTGTLFRLHRNNKISIDDFKSKDIDLRPQINLILQNIEKWYGIPLDIYSQFAGGQTDYINQLKTSDFKMALFNVREEMQMFGIFRICFPNTPELHSDYSIIQSVIEMQNFIENGPKFPIKRPDLHNAYDFHRINYNLEYFILGARFSSYLYDKKYSKRPFSK